MHMNPALLIVAIVLATTTASDALVGDWRGNSICVVRPQLVCR